MARGFVIAEKKDSTHDERQNKKQKQKQIQKQKVDHRRNQKMQLGNSRFPQEVRMTTVKQKN